MRREKPRGVPATVLRPPLAALAPALSFVLSLAALNISPSAAAAIINVPDFTVQAPATGSTSGTFDVTLVPNGVDPVPTVAAFNVRLTLTPSSPQTTFEFSTPFVQTPPIYLFGPGNAPNNPSGDPSTPYILNGQGDAPIGGDQPLNATYGLIEVPYTVTGPLTTPQTFTITVSPTISALSDSSGNDIPFAVHNGTVTITPTPEPSGALLALAGGLLLLRRRRRR